MEKLYRFIKFDGKLPDEKRKAYFVLTGDSMEHGTLWPDTFKKWDVRFYGCEIEADQDEITVKLMEIIHHSFDSLIAADQITKTWHLTPKK